MRKVLISDFSKVQLFPVDNNYRGSLNGLYDKILNEGGNFNDNFRLNESLLNELEKLSLEKYVFTTGKVQNAPEIINRVNEVFSDIYSVPMIGFLKTDVKAYVKLCGEIGAEPTQIMFIPPAENSGLLSPVMNAGFRSA